MKTNQIRNLIYLISVIGILIASYLAFLHYSDVSSICEFSEKITCDVVNKSIYSIFPPIYGLGIPVALLSIIAFITIIVFTILSRKNKEYSQYLFYLMILSIIFSIYLLMIEIFVLFRYCLFCLILDLLIISLLVLSYKLKKSIMS